jgi:hypothetical protein
MYTMCMVSYKRAQACLVHLRTSACADTVRAQASRLLPERARGPRSPGKGSVFVQSTVGAGTF